MFFTKYNENDTVTEDEMGETCSVHGWHEKCMHILFIKSWTKRRDRISLF